MHLYYARFVSHFLNSIGMVAQKEPFANLLTQGMVLGQSYRRQDTNKYLRPSEVIKTGLKLKVRCFRNLYCNHFLNVPISQ